MSVRVSLRGMLKLIRVDSLRRAHNVGFLAGRLKLWSNRLFEGSVSMFLFNKLLMLNVLRIDEHILRCFHFEKEKEMRFNMDIYMYPHIVKLWFNNVFYGYTYTA